jgi:hypothetical protein
MDVDRCPATRDGLRCVLVAGHTEPHQLPEDPGWADAPTPAQAVSKPTAIEWGGAMVAIAGGLAVLGSFLPWITATAAFVGTIGRSGLDGGGDGIITIALGIVIALLGIALLARSGRPQPARIGAAICGLILLVVAYLDIQDVNERLADLEAGVIGSVGMGLIIIAFAGVLAMLGALVSRNLGKATSSAGQSSDATAAASSDNGQIVTLGVAVAVVIAIGALAWMLLQRNVDQIMENVGRSI